MGKPKIKPELEKQVRDAIGTLPFLVLHPRSQRILQMRYGLESFELEGPKTYREIGEFMGVKEERAKSMHYRALDGLRVYQTDSVELANRLDHHYRSNDEIWNGLGRPRTREEFVEEIEDLERKGFDMEKTRKRWAIPKR